MVVDLNVVSIIGLVGVMIAVVLDLYCINNCLDDLNRRAIVIGGDRRWWTAVIILGGPLGQAAYWLYGRGEY
ncbi:MAG: hypothetical protein ACRDGS_00500 [Chloroflexota bacterium]